VGVGQSETDVADLCDTVAVIVQPGSGDVLQFLKAGIMEVPDVLVVTKADLEDIARRARRDLAAALRAVGARDTPVVAVSSIPPPSGIDELADALEAHRGRADINASRVRARRLAALAEFTLERGESAVRELGGRRAAEKVLAELDPAMPVAGLVEELERRLP
jgi:LAO/AO transport system kinase